jgi:hypothetical protein
MNRFPQFGVRTLLAAVAFIAIWLASAKMYNPVPLGMDIREVLRFLLFMAVVAAVFSSQGSDRAFWLGFLAVLVFLSSWIGSQLLSDLRPNFQSARETADYFAPQDGNSVSQVALNFWIKDSIRWICNLVLCAVGGYFGVIVYRTRAPLKNPK